MQIFGGGSMQIAKKEAARELTQYQLTTEIITKLNTLKLTPTAKLVLLYLTTCYNPNHREVFPKQKTIADKLGVSERSVTRAIQELFKEGLILIECKYTNRYKFTSRIVSEYPDKMADNLCQNVSGEGDKLSVPCIEQTKETKKEQTLTGGNVYSGDDKILADYAIKHNARNVRAYINTLKSSGSASKIISESKKKRNYTQIALRSIEETQNLIKQYRDFEQSAVSPQTCAAWVNFGKSLGY